MAMLNIKNVDRSWFLLLVVAFCLIHVSPLVHAKEIAEQDVRAGVETWVRYVTADARPETFIERMQAHRVDGRTTAYIAFLQGGGFCLCGADDLVLPVYLYSPHGTYDENIPDLQFILYEITARTGYLTEGLRNNDPDLLPYGRQLSERATYWQELISGKVPSVKDDALRADPTQMILILTCTWSQNSPYNDACPTLPTTTDVTKVGCVATAMSQIMYYWKWPNAGAGNGSVTYNYRFTAIPLSEPLAADPLIPGGWPWANRLDWAGGFLIMDGYWDESLYETAQHENSGITITPEYLVALEALWERLTTASLDDDANFAAEAYDWGVLQNVHADPVDDGDPEAAKLCHHAGVAADMDYGIISSTTSSGSDEPALEDHFRYDADAYHADRNIADMITDIQWLRPFYMDGLKEPGGGGHAWVVYGYNTGVEPTQFLVNLGKSGVNDGWYTCDNIPGDWLFEQRHTLRIAPVSVVRFVGNDIPGDGSPANPYENIEEAIAEAPDNTTLIFKAGSDNTFSAASFVVNKPLILKGKDAVIRRAW
jgi:hypothetical protein